MKNNLEETAKAEKDNYVDPKTSAKAKLIAGEKLTEEEANMIVEDNPMTKARDLANLISGGFTEADIPN